jgi:glutaredoxin
MRARRQSFGIRACLVLSALGFSVSCDRVHPLSQAELAGLHRSCERRLQYGYAVERSSNVGFAQRKPSGTPVVIYGAEWCEPCHVAADYLEMRKIPFVKLDVERDRAAKAAMQATLRDANVAAINTLPVLDIRGTVMAGFNPCIVDAAWAG